MEILISILLLIVGLIVLLWSADKFVDGSVIISRYFGMPPLLIGMIVIGFGTSAPEMLVSALASFQNNPGIALGNAYGSNITNIALILGVTAIIKPIAVHSSVLKKELPILTFVSLLAAFLIFDNLITRFEAIILLIVFVGLLSWTIYQGISNNDDTLTKSLEEGLQNNTSIKKGIIWSLVGLIILIISSRIIVWSSVKIAGFLGISDLIIGLTIVAVGTSLPELASSISAAKKGEHDLALGNILGSNLFNTLVVVGIAGVINPLKATPEVFSRDIIVMIVMTVSLFIMGYGLKGKGRINRIEGSILLISYAVYVLFVIYS